VLAVLMASALMMCAPAQAAPVAEELDSWLAHKGLLSQMTQASQSVTNKASELVVHAMGFLGVPYQRGGGTVETGFDCSGFVKAIFEQTVGLVLPRKAEQQAADTQRIDKKELVPGDLVFFNTMHRAYSHVGIYVGDGKFIHSPKPGAEVRIESLAAAYWNRRFDGARRVGNGAEEVGKAAVVLK
jgi:cell wall-associated NlpC family hydrolase